MLAEAKLEQGVESTLVDVLSKCTCGSFYICADLLDSRRLTIYEQNLDMKDQIPSRYSKRVFDRFAPFIGAALRAYPRPVTIESNLSPRTVQRCVEEALVAKRQYQHTHPSVDESLWQEHGAKLGTCETDGKIRVGDRKFLRLPAATPGTTPLPIEYAVVPTESSLRALAQLLASNAINPKPAFFVRGTDATLRAILERQYDIVFTPDDADSTKHYIS